MIVVYVAKRCRLTDDVDFLDITTLADTKEASEAKSRLCNPKYTQDNPIIDIICVKIPENDRLAELTALISKTSK